MMAEHPVAQPTFICKLCSARFGRAEHLKRHSLNHVSERPHKCAFCGSSYKRGDVLRRHWKSCSSRERRGEDVPKPMQGGKRKQACDSCAALKKSCNRGQPCQTCITRDNPCSYTRVFNRTEQNQESSAPNNDSMGPNKESIGDFAEPVHADTYSGVDFDWFDGYGINSLEQECDFFIIQEASTSLKSMSNTSLFRFDFLLNFTQVSGINNAYNYKKDYTNSSESVDQQRSFETTSKNNRDNIPSDSNVESLAGWTSPLSWEGDMIDIYTNPVASTGYEVNFLDSSFILPQPFEDSLFLKSGEICEKFKPLLTNLSNATKLDSKVTRTITTKDISEFFCPENIRTYIALFWERWYPHAPIVHKPSFIIEQSHTLLAMSMTLMGACTSSTRQDVQRAKSLLDLAEELIFLDNLFSTNTKGPANDGYTIVEKVNVLQATYFMCIMQKWEGDEIAKQRIRRQRFSSFIAAIRNLGVSSATHGNHLSISSFGEPEWHDYIWKEEMIRTFNYVFLLDSSFVIFHNSPPRLVLQEMAIDLTCPEACFHAASVEEFLIEMQKSSEITTKTPQLTDIIRALFSDGLDVQKTPLLIGASKLNLFTVVTALHSLIFHQRMSLITLPFATAPLYRALDNWTSIWKFNTSNFHTCSPAEPWKADGFMLYAEEFALLARAHLDNAVASENHWHGMLPTPGPSISPKTADGLSSLDETSMSQIRDLMLSFEHLNIY